MMLAYSHRKVTKNEGYSSLNVLEDEIPTNSENRFCGVHPRQSLVEHATL
jgi:hypothetical protein